MNHFRTRHPSYAKPTQRRRSPDNGSAAYPETDDDSNEGMSMADFASQSRKRREELYHKSDVRARSKRKGATS